MACYSPWGHEESDMTELYGTAKQVHSSRFKIFPVNHVVNAYSTVIRFHFFKSQDSIKTIAHKSKEEIPLNLDHFSSIFYSFLALTSFETIKIMGLTLSSIHGILLCPQNSPNNNTGVGCHSLIQGIFLAQAWNLCLLHCWWIFTI